MRKKNLFEKINNDGGNTRDVYTQGTEDRCCRKRRKPQKTPLDGWDGFGRHVKSRNIP